MSASVRDALSGLHGLDRERRREMALAGAAATASDTHSVLLLLPPFCVTSDITFIFPIT
jgi:hypothetical protein